MAVDMSAIGFEVLPSKANFLLARHPSHEAETLSAKLRERGVIVRHFRNPQRVAPYLRISVGTDAQCAALLAALRDVLG
jgi:histidinol-phosphate aminotransferase